MQNIYTISPYLEFCDRQWKLRNNLWCHFLNLALTSSSYLLTLKLKKRLLNSSRMVTKCSTQVKNRICHESGSTCWISTSIIATPYSWNLKACIVDEWVTPRGLGAGLFLGQVQQHFAAYWVSVGWIFYAQ